MRRIACDSDLIVLVEKDGNPLSVGRKTRVIPKALRRALWARDKGCRFPGCGRTRYVEAHHCVHWALGGETRLEDLVLLCTQHHRLHHEGGFTMEKDYRGRWFFRNADGRAVPACGYRPEDITDATVGADEYFGGRVPAETSGASGAASRVPAGTSRTSAEGFAVNDPSVEAWTVRESAEAYCPAPRFTRLRASAETPLM